MPGTPPPSLPQAHEALAALERYLLYLRQLASSGVDPELYHRFSLAVQDVRRCCHELPPLSARWVALLIAHAELSQALWRAGQPGAPSTQERQRLLAQVQERVLALQQQCMELLGPAGGAH